MQTYQSIWSDPPGPALPPSVSGANRCAELCGSWVPLTESRAHFISLKIVERNSDLVLYFLRGNEQDHRSGHPDSSSTAPRDLIMIVRIPANTTKNNTRLIDTVETFDQRSHHGASSSNKSNSFSSPQCWMPGNRNFAALNWISNAFRNYPRLDYYRINDCRQISASNDRNRKLMKSQNIRRGSSSDPRPLRRLRKRQ